MMTSSRFTVEEVLSQADMVCYEAKTAGRNRYRLSDSLPFNRPSVTRKYPDCDAFFVAVKRFFYSSKSSLANQIKCNYIDYI